MKYQSSTVINVQTRDYLILNIDINKVTTWWEQKFYYLLVTSICCHPDQCTHIITHLNIYASQISIKPILLIPHTTFHSKTSSFLPSSLPNSFSHYDNTYSTTMSKSRIRMTMHIFTLFVLYLPFFSRVLSSSGNGVRVIHSNLLCQNTITLSSQTDPTYPHIQYSHKQTLLWLTPYLKFRSISG